MRTNHWFTRGLLAHLVEGARSNALMSACKRRVCDVEDGTASGGRAIITARLPEGADNWHECDLRAWYTCSRLCVEDEFMSPAIELACQKGTLATCKKRLRRQRREHNAALIVAAQQSLRTRRRAAVRHTAPSVGSDRQLLRRASVHRRPHQPLFGAPPNLQRLAPHRGPGPAGLTSSSVESRSSCRRRSPRYYFLRVRLYTSLRPRRLSTRASCSIGQRHNPCVQCSRRPATMAKKVSFILNTLYPPLSIDGWSRPSRPVSTSPRSARCSTSSSTIR